MECNCFLNRPRLYIIATLSHTFPHISSIWDENKTDFWLSFLDLIIFFFRAWTASTSKPVIGSSNTRKVVGHLPGRYNSNFCFVP